MKFGSPWGRSLTIRTVVVGVILVAITIFVQQNMAESFGDYHTLAWLSVILFIPLNLPFVVRGYELADDRMIIQRLFHQDVIRYAIIKKAFLPKNLDEKLSKTMGVEMFSLAGSYKNRELGLFNAYVNDWENAVCVETLYGKSIVAPDQPEKFIAEIEKRVEKEKERQKKDQI